MPDLADGETFEMQGSGAKPYQIKNVGGVYSCTCPAWRNQSLPINVRTCKHIRKLRGDAAEEARIQSAEPLKPLKPEGAEDVVELPVLLAHVWDGELDPTGWWMSEKLDGVRAYWDGKQFLSRKNNIFYAPDWFTDGLPRHPLDGELWIARKQFDRTSGLVRRQDKPDTWKEVRYLVFDAPDARGPFEDRMKFLTDVSGKWKAKFAALHEHVVCNGIDHLVTELDRVTALGGEGVMLRKPGSTYERTRSTTLLKVKKFLDAEAVVIGYEAGLGRHKGRVGALMARFGNGKEFKVGTGLKDRERENPPAVGSIINVKYQELTKDGIPRFPVYVGLRPEGNPNAAPPTRKNQRSEVRDQRSEDRGQKSEDTGRKSKTKGQKDAAVPLTSDLCPLTSANEPTPVFLSSGGSKMAATPKRYFEFVDGTSNKFWEIWMDGKDVTTQWGKIGTNGQTKTKTFADEAKAKKEYDKLLAEKTGKGYVEKQRPS
jgi:DNA ligase-1